MWDWAGHPATRTSGALRRGCGGVAEGEAEGGAFASAVSGFGGLRGYRVYGNHDRDGSGWRELAGRAL